MQVFNNNNLSSQMYHEWACLRPQEICNERRVSVLHKLPQMNATTMVNCCVKPLAALLTSSSSSSVSYHHHSEMPSPADYLRNDRDVLWIMEVICYGLSLPLSTNEQHEAVRDCVHLYCEWLTALTPAKAKAKSIPFPIRDDANLYCRKILEHVYNVFIPRVFTGQESNIMDVIQRQAVLCHRVLRTIECVAHDEHNLMDSQTWDSLLIFLLAINDTLLSPPVEHNDIGTLLCERIVSVLFDVWLMSCVRCFPSPSYWKTFQQLSCNWRHRPALIQQWNRVNYALTQKLVQQMSPSATIVSSNVPLQQQNFIKIILDEMSQETVKQSWYRFMHTIGNPFELCFPEIISKTDKFYHSACASENVVDPRQHPCLNQLPYIFYRAMRGVSSIVDIFLGIPMNLDETDVETMYKSTASIAANPKETEPATPPEKRKITFPLTINKGPQKGTSTASSKSHATQKPEQFMVPQTITPPIMVLPSCDHVHHVLAPSRPKSTSILDIFGDWLFQAALFGTESKGHADSDAIARSSSVTSFTQVIDSSGNIRKASGPSERIVIEPSPHLTAESFEAGQAEAIGALCRLFCFKRADEEISIMLNKPSHPASQKVKHYLTKFHLALNYGLAKEPIKRQLMASILINSTKIFQIDLSGGSLLIPHYLKALEIYLFPREKANNKSEIEIRRACIKILLSLLSYPYHFNELPIKDTLTETPSTTFQSLHPRLINLLIQALVGEPDSTNVQMLLGGFLLAVQDAAIYEINNPVESEPNSETSRSSSFISETLRNESPIQSNLQFVAHHYDPNCDMSLTSNDIPYSDDGKGIPDTARGLFCRSLFHVGHVLNKCRDKNHYYDSHVSLAALEVLSAFGRIHFKSYNSVTTVGCSIECKDTTKQICVFIESQCEKPAPFHSKDMHSTIVAAYQCLVVWYHEHPHLLKDRECVSMLFEVIELGISGTKSKRNGYVFKAEKQLKPASMRVREAAESLLTLLMNHFGFCPLSPSLPETIVGASLLDETTLLKHMFLGNNLTLESACEKFKYFVTDNLIMIGILDQPNDKETVCIIRSPFGKYCWSFKFQQLPWKHNLKIPPEHVSRPLPKVETTNPQQMIHPRYFPESLDKIRSTKFDTIVPALESIILSTPELKGDHEIMLNIIDKVESNIKFEKQKLQRSLLPTKSMECKEPPQSNDFEAARLILSHFGFLSFEALQEPPMGQVIPSLIALNYRSPEFASNLKTLDSISNRTSDTIFIYYVRKGMTSPNDIMLSVKNRSFVSKQFREFLSSLGCIVDVNTHSGWTGHMSTSWKKQSPTNYHDDNSLMLDGRSRVIYWADVSHEIVFVLPSELIDESDNGSMDGDAKLRTVSDVQSDTRSTSSMSDDGGSMGTHSKALENESNRSSLRRKFRNLLHNNGCDVKVLVIWLESMDDLYSISINSLLLTTGTGVESNLNDWKDYIAIIIHPLNNGLFRITIQGSAGRFPLPLPLIDGMVINNEVLGTFVRLTSLNICRRRRLDTESFQPPHVKRRLKIQEIVNKFRLQLYECEFYNSLFTSK